MAGVVHGEARFGVHFEGRYMHQAVVGQHQTRQFDAVAAAGVEAGGERLGLQASDGVVTEHNVARAGVQFGPWVHFHRRRSSGSRGSGGRHSRGSGSGGGDRSGGGGGRSRWGFGVGGMFDGRIFALIGVGRISDASVTASIAHVQAVIGQL